MRFKCCFCNCECEKEDDHYYCDICNVRWTSDYNLIKQPERSKREDIIETGVTLPIGYEKGFEPKFIFDDAVL